MAINYNAAIPLNMFLQKRAGSISLTAQQNIDQLIKSLFANSEQGFAYNPNDLTTMFQDAAGTIPVTGAGQPVGLVKDKSGRNNHAYQTVSASRPLLGRHPVTGVRNLIKFSEDSSKWSAYAGGTGLLPTVTYGFADPLGTNTASRIVLNKGAGTSTADQSTVSPQAPATMGTVVGKSYTASVWMRTTDGASKQVLIDFNGETPNAGTVGLVTVTPTWSRYVIKQLSAMDSARSLSIRLRGTFSTDASASIDVWAPQHEEGLNVTAYQRTNNVYDVTEAGVQSSYHLYFDGVDDFLQTNNIDFTSTDKVSVFAGVRKLSDVNSAIVIEHGVAGVNNKAFTMSAPDGNNLSNYSASLRNTSRATVFLNNKASPRSSVLSVELNYTGATITDQVKMIENATPAPPSTGGSLLTATNFNDAPIYIGRRAGRSLPFYGHIYGLIGIGKLTSDSETAAIEKELAKRTGVTLSV